MFWKIVFTCLLVALTQVRGEFISILILFPFVPINFYIDLLFNDVSQP